MPDRPPAAPVHPALTGFEPFRWLREYPPGMFDGLVSRLRWGRVDGPIGQPTTTGTWW